MLSKKGVKANFLSGIFTAIIIGLLVLSESAEAVSISFSNLPDSIDVSGQPYLFNLNVQITENGFLPLQFADLVFKKNDDETATCHIENDAVTGCEFLEFVSKEVSNLNNRWIKDTLKFS